MFSQMPSLSPTFLDMTFLFNGWNVLPVARAMRELKGHMKWGILRVHVRKYLFFILSRPNYLSRSVYLSTF